MAGSASLADPLSPMERAGTQGSKGFLLNPASGFSRMGSGVVYAVGGYGGMGMTAAAMAAAPLGLDAWWQTRGRPGRSPQA